MAPRRVAIVPHTHWDREWYESFQSFRLRLVDTLDALIPLMESDPSYARFLLDGQMAALDDYLEVRPHNEDRIRALAGSGRLTMGPWYALMDEFLVSAETIVRDLQLGMQRASEFGGAMQIGYLPDMFGHVAQMPQILRLAGFEHAVVWRGVPSAITKTAFSWEAPDGSSVRAEYLPFGYGNGSLLPDDAKALVRRVADHAQQMEPFLIDDILLMNGSDHLPAQPALGRVIAEANELQEDFVFEITSLPEYLDGRGDNGIDHWSGELRSGARANMLMGVTSNRVDVKRAAAATERSLEGRAEPFSALFRPAWEWPDRLLEIAWTSVVRNAAHDSICACSVDDVVDAVLHRFSEARDIADGLATKALSALGASMAEAGLFAVNPSQRSRSGIVEMVIGTPLPGGRDGVPIDMRTDVQVVSERTALPAMLILDAETARTVLAMIEGSKVDADAWIQAVHVEENETGIDVTVSIGPDERPDQPIAQPKQDLLARLGARPSAQVRVRLDQPAIRRIVARVDDVPGFGWRSAVPAALKNPVISRESTDEVSVSNGLVNVVISKSDGTFAIDGVTGMGRLVDEGDLGDSYNYSPPASDQAVQHPDSVTVTVVEDGPVRARVAVVSHYRWPDRVDSATQARCGEREVEVTTTLEVHAEDRTVRARIDFVNPARDHRLRVHFPLPKPASYSEAESAFAIVRRGLFAEGRPEERGLPTYPARRFVRAGGLTIAHDGVTEYELTDVEGEGDLATASTLALTVLRATGMLSRLGMSYRPLPAGPLTTVDGLQMVGRYVTFRSAISLVDDVDPWALAEDLLLPLEVTGSRGGGIRPLCASMLDVSGAQVSAVRRDAGMLEARVFNPRAEPATVSFGDRSGWLVDLRGAPIEPFEGTFELRGHGIATVRLYER